MMRIIPILFLATQLFMSFSVKGADLTTIETNSFAFSLPSSWEIIELKNPAKISGPSNEIVLVSSAAISGAGDETEKNAVREETFSNLIAAIKDAGAAPDLVTLASIEQTNLNNGLVLFELHSQTKDGERYFYQFGIVGLNNAVLVTVEGSVRSAGGVQEVREAVKSIEWK